MIINELTYHSEGIVPSITKFELFINFFNSIKILIVFTVLPSSKSILTNER